MKNKINQIILGSLVFIHLLLSSCNFGEFGDANKNPNATSVPITSALLTNAILSLGNASVIEGFYCQYFSESQFTDYSRYTNLEYSFGIYLTTLYDLENIILINNDPNTKETALANGSNANQIAVARILKVFFFALTTDELGDIPYFEALKKEPFPAYDPQDVVYKDLFKELDEAVRQFDKGQTVKGDILFNGNITRWKKFANSLRLIHALRVSKVDPALGKAQALAALAADQGVIDNNVDNAALTYPGTNFRHPWFNVYNGFKPYGISDVMVSQLSAINDPRLPVFGAPNTQGKVIGIPYGLPREQAIEFITKNPSWAFVLAPNYRRANSTHPILTAAHVSLARAEAAALGWTTENAQTLYEAGIRTSLQFWQVFNQATYDAYVKNPQIALSGTDDLDKIRLQRWLGFYPNGYQGWSEWRRTGIPNLQPTVYAVNASKQIPRRFVYWLREANLNPENYRKASERLGGDTMDGRVWWDK